MATVYKRTKTQGQIEAENVYMAIAINIPDKPSMRSPLEAHYARTWGRGGSWEIDCGRCKVCNTPIDVTRFEFNFLGQKKSWPENVCSDCYTRHIGEYYSEAAPEIAGGSTLWDAYCPPRIRQAVEASSLPPSVDRNAYSEVCAWRPEQGSKGLYARGPSGCGKTTAVYALARELERNGHKCIVLNSVELNRALQRASKDAEAIHIGGILIIDDLGKEKASPGATSLFYELLNYRLNHHLPLIVTTRFEGKDLRKRFSDEDFIGDDILRRMEALCRPVEFKLPQLTRAA